MMTKCTSISSWQNSASAKQWSTTTAIQAFLVTMKVNWNVLDFLSVQDKKKITYSLGDSVEAHDLGETGMCIDQIIPGRPGKFITFLSLISTSLDSYVPSCVIHGLVDLECKERGIKPVEKLKMKMFLKSLVIYTLLPESKFRVVQNLNFRFYNLITLNR